MPGAAVAASGAAVSGAPAGGGTVPFWFGSNVYAKKFDTTNSTLGTSTIPVQRNIPPNGYMSAVRLQVRSTGGSGGTMAADAPWNCFSSMELDDVDGANILYPMGGYQYKVANQYSRPWNGDPARRFDFANSANPSFSLQLQPEIRHTAGVLANTDARSQFNLSYTVNTLANVITTSVSAPTLAITAYLEVWAQPDTQDLAKNAVDPTPPGLALQTKRRHQTGTLNGAGANNTMQLSLTGNEIRWLGVLIRDSNNARQDYLSDPINWMLDNKNLGVFSPDEVFNLGNDFYDMLQNGTSVRDTGLYQFPRFYQPGKMVGQAWLGTTNATYLILESTTLATASNVPGTWEMIVDEAIPIAPLDMQLESI
jgi:hypothetical protein